MTCQRCGTANPKGARFCMACGAPQAAICPDCRTPAAPGARFCIQCGTSLTPAAPAGPTPAAPAGPISAAPAGPTPAAPAATSSTEVERLLQYIPKELLAKLESARAAGGMQGERRIVTMLFCDVQGSTAAAGRMDPEEWAEIMKGAFQRLITPIYRYEGVLARLMGDAILAFFGAPIAHEDDPQRAVLAGLEILQSIQPYRDEVRRRWGIQFDVRVGINTGLVVVGEMGSDLRVEYTAMGDAVNLAARMEQTAQPGTVQIAEPTYKLVAPLFEVESLGGVAVKGKDEPVAAYLVRGPKVQPGRLRGIAGLSAPMVGRQHELRSLTGALAHLQSGCGQIISVMAEAGLGKSRLVAEVRSQAAPRPDLQWFEGRALSYNISTHYSILTDLLESICGLTPGLTDEARYGAIEGRVAEVLPDRAPEVAPFLAAMLGVPLTGAALERVRYLEPPQVKQRVFAAVKTLIAALAAARPLVLVFEDLHWSDPTSLDLILELLPLPEQHPLLLIAVSRPNRHEPSWRFHEVALRDFGHIYTHIPLKPLDEGESRTLVGELLRIEGLPERARRLILEKAEGNPFFVEEVIRSLLDAGLVVRDGEFWRATREIERIAVPDTLSGVLTARLDALSEEGRRVLQIAAVIGREFGRDTLAALHESPHTVDSCLTELQRRELIREKSRLPERTFWFRHVLTQEAAYGSLLLSRRRELHRRLAARLEAATPDRVHEVARHYVEANEPGKALPYAVQAGERAARAYASQEAIGWFRRALAAAGPGTDPDLIKRAYEGLGGALTFTGDVPGAVKVYEEMLELAGRSGHVPSQVSALNKLSILHALFLGQFPEADRKLSNSEQLARQYSDKAGLSELYFVRCMMCTAAADFDGVLRYMDEAIEIGRELNIREQMASGMEHIAMTHIRLTEFERAREAALEGLEIARSVGDRLHEGTLLAGPMAQYHLSRGEVAAATESAQAAMQIAAEIGSTMVQMDGVHSLGRLAQITGRYEEALRHYEQLEKIGVEIGWTFYAVLALCARGAIYTEISPSLAARAHALHERASRLMEHPGGAIVGATVFAEIGFCALASGAVDEAEEQFEKGLSHPSMTMHLERSRLLLGLALVDLARGRTESATRRVAEAQEFAEARQMRNILPLAALVRGRVAAARQDWTGALEAFQESESLAAAMQIAPVLKDARAEAARALTRLGRAGEAEAARGAARQTVEEMAAAIADPELQAALRSQAALI